MTRKELYKQFKDSKEELIAQIKEYGKAIVKEYSKKEGINYEYVPIQFEMLNLERGFTIMCRYGSAREIEITKASFSDFLENRIHELIYL